MAMATELVQYIQSMDRRIQQEKKTEDLILLHHAILDVNIEKMQYILSDVANKKLLAEQNFRKETALQLALLVERTDLVKVLIDAATSFSNDDPHSSVTFCEAFIRQTDENMETALHIAARQGMLDIAKLLVEADPNVTNIQNCNGETPIFLAAKHRHNDIVKMISICLDGPGGSTALHAAILCYDKDGNTEQVQYLLSDINKDLLVKVDSSKQTALHLAVLLEHTDVVKFLIDAATSFSNDDPHSSVTFCEAFVRQADDKLETALHLAARLGSVATTKLLVEADPNDTHIRNLNGETPVYLALKCGHYDIVKMICSTCTAPISLDGPDGSTGLHEAILCQDKGNRKNLVKILIDAAKRSPISEDVPSSGSFEAVFSKTNNDGFNALRLALRENEPDVVELIILENPAYQAGNASDINQLKFLSQGAAEKGHREMVKVLCEAYEARNTFGNKGLAAFYAAVVLRDAEAVFSMLEEDKHIATYTDEDTDVIRGWTQLHFAAFYEFDAILEAIVEAQVEVGYQPVYREGTYTPLIVAAERGHTSTVIQLMKLLPPSSFIAVNNQGENMLHLAVAQSKKEMIRYIVNYCPNKYISKILNQKDVNGDTPLHLAIKSGCFISELIKHKRANRMAKNKRNWTPVDMLYFEDDVIADQAHIKKALDDIEESEYWKFWRKSYMAQSLVLGSKRSAKDVKFKEEVRILMIEKHKQMKEELERYRNRTNTQIIVTALIATVTFTVGFTMPGGYHQSGELDEGLVILSSKKAFNAFMVSDALALVLSTSCLFLYFIASMYEDAIQVSKLNAASTILNIVSVVAMMVTFITGTFVVLSHSLALAITICVICSFFFILVIVLLIKLRYDRKLEKVEV